MLDEFLDENITLTDNCLDMNSGNGEYNGEQNSLPEKNRVIKNHAVTMQNIEVPARLQNQNKEFITDFVNQLKQKIESVKTLVIDRFEGNLAVCENRETGEMMNIDISKLPENIEEGDVLKLENNKYQIDEEKRKEIEDRITNKLQDLFEE